MVKKSLRKLYSEPKSVEEFEPVEEFEEKKKTEEERILKKKRRKEKRKSSKKEKSGERRRYHKPDYFNSDEEYTISMAVKMKTVEKLNNSSGEIKAAINWILSQNIKVSPLNMTYKRNYYLFVPRNYSDKIVEDTGTRLSFFTEAEDEEILQRILFLKENGVITTIRGLCNELREDSNIPKDTKRIIGLYLCQNLTNRLAFYTTERMLKLMDRVTATPKKAKVVTSRRPWTLEDDQIIVKSVLFDDTFQW